MSETIECNPWARKSNDSARNGAGTFVLLVLDRALRAQCNPALTQAISIADASDMSVVALIVLDPDDPNTNRRQWWFRIESLAQLKADLADLGIKLLVRVGDRRAEILDVADDSSCVVVDAGYLREERKWRDTIASELNVSVFEVEASIVVPIRVASEKMEYAAQHFRRKVWDHVDSHLLELTAERASVSSLPLPITSNLDADDPSSLIEAIGLDPENRPMLHIEPGRDAAEARLNRFIEDGLPGYAEKRSDPMADAASKLSADLRNGLLSPIEIAMAVRSSRRRSTEDRDAFLEELIVRREVAINYVHYCDQYDSLDGLPDWARETLSEHEADERAERYTRKELLNCETSDSAWNQAMRSLVETGYVHNHMRMYWGKQVLVWTNTPQYAHRILLEFNNTYFLDGHDPNSFANVAWIFGRHDRPWQERDVVGKIRPMTRSGLERKFDVEAYVDSDVTPET
jgi:deoxyribodipyrimidine photo-lyase